MPDYFDNLKLELGITWTDTDTDAVLEKQCIRAAGILSKEAGETLEFSLTMDDQDQLQLLYDCVRYIRNNALDEFMTNFRRELDLLRWNVQAEDDDETAEA